MSKPELNFDLIIEQNVAEKVMTFLGAETAKLGERPEMNAGTYTRKIIQVPESLFEGLTANEIIASCKIINDSPTQPFIITHSWTDAELSKGHTVTAHPVDLSLKLPLSTAQGCHVSGKWSPQAPYEYFIAEVAAVHRMPFIDTNSFKKYEMSLNILVYRDSSGHLVEPTKPIRVGVHRHMLLLRLGKLSDEQIRFFKEGMQSSCPTVQP